MVPSAACRPCVACKLQRASTFELVVRRRVFMTRRKGRCISKEPSDEAGQLEKLQSSFAQHLPVEILSAIFLLGIPSSYASSVNATTLEHWRTFFSNVFPMNLTGVCRSWRQVALWTRALWSTFYVQIHNSSHKALSMAECFVKRFLRRSGDCTVKCGIRFTGTLKFTRACDSVRRLLEHQERWEEVDISFGKRQSEGVSDSTLDLAKLTSLRALRVDGTFWDCAGVDPGIVDDDSPHPENALQLPSLRTAKLINLRPLTYLGILTVAPNLTELSLHICDNISNGRHIILPALRKLEIVQYSASAPDESLTSILKWLECRALEELSVERLATPHPVEFIAFVVRCRLDATISSLHLQYAHNFLLDAQHELYILVLLRLLKSLRSLAVHGSISKLLVSSLGRTNDDNSIHLCPHLEELVLGKATADANVYTDLVRARWNAPGKRIKSMTFLDCNTRSGMDETAQELTFIHGVDACIQEGLKLDIRFSSLASNS